MYYMKVVVFFCVAVIITGKTIPVDFHTCSILCSNENDQRDTVPIPLTGNHLMPHKGKRGRRGRKGERGPQGAKGEPGIECNMERVVQLEEQLFNLKTELEAVNNKQASLEERVGGSLVESTSGPFVESTVSTSRQLEDRTGKSYELRSTREKGTFNEARIMCAEMGGKLMQDTLTKNIGGKTYKDEMMAIMGEFSCWIGITDHLQEGNWLYLNGDKFPESTSNLIVDWQPGEPNNWGSNGENYGQAFIRSGIDNIFLNDAEEAYTRFYGCCEIVIDDEQTTTVLYRW